jgi:hypothetical protein
MLFKVSGRKLFEETGDPNSDKGTIKFSSTTDYKYFVLTVPSNEFEYYKFGEEFYLTPKEPSLNYDLRDVLKANVNESLFECAKRRMRELRESGSTVAAELREILLPNDSESLFECAKRRMRELEVCKITTTHIQSSAPDYLQIAATRDGKTLCSVDGGYTWGEWFAVCPQCHHNHAGLATPGHRPAPQQCVKCGHIWWPPGVHPFGKWFCVKCGGSKWTWSIDKKISQDAIATCDSCHRSWNPWEG